MNEPQKPDWPNDNGRSVDHAGSAIDSPLPPAAKETGTAQPKAICQECDWTNSNLLNLGSPTEARMVCLGCCKRAIECRDELAVQLATKPAQPMTEGGTPRTDLEAVATTLFEKEGPYIHSDFARTLERELTAALSQSRVDRESVERMTEWKDGAYETIQEMTDAAWGTWSAGKMQVETIGQIERLRKYYEDGTSIERVRESNERDVQLSALRSTIERLEKELTAANAKARENEDIAALATTNGGKQL